MGRATDCSVPVDPPVSYLGPIQRNALHALLCWRCSSSYRTVHATAHIATQGRVTRNIEGVEGIYAQLEILRSKCLKCLEKRQVNLPKSWGTFSILLRWVKFESSLRIGQCSTVPHHRAVTAGWHLGKRILNFRADVAGNRYPNRL